ncbi:type III secretion system inner membrane ring lipoprotein SctJ [Dyella flagellata]|uniref:Lipoprotein n=1 Tax=Dyella flagellata TaxID=1867833 RepID=A0ABQ5XB39_9GAMM|nr:type III secretion inner membrane ring lipoprotein SctJ [Dyella flagellata]GLQ87838.1 EscJ/YscJ/HrcJ family type III secretion inner membrane ring protein [Dyella flagellata]
MPKRMFYKACRLAALVLALGLLVGCSREVLYNKLDEQQANEVIAALLNNGIDADKRPAERGDGWQVVLDRHDMPAAVAVLRDQGLPHQSIDNIGQVFKKDGFVSSPLEDKQRFIYAREQQLGHTLRQFDGVVDAYVYLSIPDKSPIDDKPPGGSASVVIITRPNAGIEGRAPDIKAAVMNGTEGLTDASRVTVQFFQRTPTELPQAASNTGLLRSELTSLAMIGLAVLVLLLAGVVLWRNRGALLGGRPRSLARSGVSHER